MRKQTIIHGPSGEHPLRVVLLSVSPLPTDHRLADRTAARICVNLLDIRDAQSDHSDSRHLFTPILRNPYNASLFLILLLYYTVYRLWLLHDWQTAPYTESTITMTTTHSMIFSPFRTKCIFFFSCKLSVGFSETKTTL